MADAVITQITKAVTTKLEAVKNSLSIPFTVKRVHVPDYLANTPLGVAVFVSAGGEVSGERATRNGTEYEIEIPLAIASPAKLSDPDGVDALIYLAQEITDYLNANEASVSGASMSECVNALPYDPELLDQQGTFLSIVTIRYMTQR